MGRLKAVLKVLTDILTFGRSQGWWSRGNSLPSGRDLEKPHLPDGFKK